MSSGLTSAVTMNKRGRSHRLVLRGEFDHSLDADTVDMLREMVKVDPSATWVVDASGLTFVDTEFISFLLGIVETLEAGSLQVVATPMATRLLDLMGLAARVGLIREDPDEQAGERSDLVSPVS